MYRLRNLKKRVCWSARIILESVFLGRLRNSNRRWKGQLTPRSRAGGKTKQNIKERVLPPKLKWQVVKKQKQKKSETIDTKEYNLPIQREQIFLPINYFYTT